MTRVRRMMVVLAGLAMTALLTSSHLFGDISNTKPKNIALPRGGEKAALADDPADLARSRLTQQTVLTYQPLQGEPLFALQLQPELPQGPRRPRDLALVVSIAAGQAGASWNAAQQLVATFCKNAAAEDRLALWIVGTPDAKFTRNLAGQWLTPRDDVKRIEKALADLKEQYPAGNTDLEHGLRQVLPSFDREGRQRALVYLGDGQSQHKPLGQAARTKLAKDMVERQIAFYPVPLGKQFDSANLHGLATGTGGAVLRVQIFAEKVEEAVQRAEKVLAAPVFYPTGVAFGQGVVNPLPRELPPLRADVPTLVVGQYKKDLDKLSVQLRGVVAGQAEFVNKTLTFPLPKTADDHYFLVSLHMQWRQAPEQPALIQADRALVFAFEKNRLQHLELLNAAQTALQQNELQAAQKLYARAKELVPHDAEAKAGLQVVANLQSGKLTREGLREQLEKAAHNKGVRIEQVQGKLRLTKGEMVALAQVGQEPAVPAKIKAAAPVAQEDLLRQRKALEEIEQQKVEQNVEDVLRRARKLLRDNPEEAHELLRAAVLQIQDHPDLRENIRERLVTRLQAALRDVAIRGRAIADRRAEMGKIAALAKANEDRANQVMAAQDRFAARFNVFRSLMNQGRLEEQAMRDIVNGMAVLRNEAVTQGLEVPVSTTSLYFSAIARYNLERYNEIKALRDRRFLETLLAVERSAVPFPDEPPVVFPPLTTWNAITKLRKDRYNVSSIPDDYEARKQAHAIQEMLKQPIDMKDFQVPMKLKEALGLIYEKLAAQKKELPILIDAEAFKVDNPEAPDIYDTEVKFPPFPRQMALTTALRLALSQIPTQNATYIIRKDHVEITTANRVVEEKALRVYPVGELVMPISMGGMMGMMGMGMMGMGGGGMMGMGMMGMGGGMMGMMGMGGMNMMGGMMGMGGMNMMGGMMGMGGMNMMGMGGGMNMMGMGGMNMMGMGGMNMMGMGGMGMMGMGGMGMMGMNMMGGMMGMGMGGMMMGMMGMNGSFAGGFNGNLGFMGATQAMPLIQLVTQVVAPGEWFTTPAQQAYQNIQGGFAGIAGFGLGFQGIGAGFNMMGNMVGMAGINGVGLAGINGVGGFNPGFAGALGGAGIGGLAGVAGFQGFQGGPPTPVEEGGPADIRRANTIEFFAPSLALIVRASTRVHYNIEGGVIAAKVKEIPGPGQGAPNLGIKADNPGVIAKIGGPRKVGGVAGLDDHQKNKVGAGLAEIDPRKVWDEALLKSGGDPGVAIATADFLFENQKFQHVVEFLKAALRHGVLIRPWTYEALAIAMESAGSGSPEEIQRVRLSALALEPNNVHSYLQAAEAMAEHKDYSRALSFCRQAALLVPNLAQTYEAALGYAELARDSQAMAWAAGQLLQRDWPHDNHQLHLKARAKVEALSRTLQRERKDAEAQQLQAALEQVRQRDLVIRLSWEGGASGPADLELQVKEPTGSLCSSQQRQTPGGGTLLGNNLSELTRASYVAAQAFPGEYQLTVRSVWGQPLGSKARLEIIQHQGTAKESRQLVTISTEQKEQTLKVQLKEGRREQLVVVPPTVPQRENTSSEELRKKDNILVKLRQLADPFYNGSAATGFRGGVGASTTSRLVQDQPLQTPPAGQKEQSVFQAAAGSAAGVQWMADASVSQDHMTVRLIPNFQHLQDDRPVQLLDLPLIPGGRSN